MKSHKWQRSGIRHMMKIELKRYSMQWNIAKVFIRIQMVSEWTDFGPRSQWTGNRNESTIIISFFRWLTDSFSEEEEEFIMAEEAEENNHEDDMRNLHIDGKKLCPSKNRLYTQSTSYFSDDERFADAQEDWTLYTLIPLHATVFSFHGKCNSSKNIGDS